MSKIEGSRLHGHDVRSAQWRYEHIALKGGYRWIKTVNSELRGPHLPILENEASSYSVYIMIVV